MDETSDRPDRPEWRVELPHYRFADFRSRLQAYLLREMAS